MRRFLKVLREDQILPVSCGYFGQMSIMRKGQLKTHKNCTSSSKICTYSIYGTTGKHSCAFKRTKLLHVKLTKLKTTRFIASCTEIKPTRRRTTSGSIEIESTRGSCSILGRRCPKSILGTSFTKPTER